MFSRTMTRRRRACLVLASAAAGLATIGVQLVAPAPSSDDAGRMGRLVQVAAPPEAHAAGGDVAQVAARRGLHDLRVKNVGSKRFVVADHFEWPRDASPIQRTCGASLSTRRTWLQPGQWSSSLIIPSLAKDVDCIEVPRGWSLKRSKVGPNSTYVKCSATRDRAVARKVAPAPWEKRFYLKKC